MRSLVNGDVEDVTGHDKIKISGGVVSMAGLQSVALTPPAVSESPQLPLSPPEDCSQEHASAPRPVPLSSDGFRPNTSLAPPTSDQEVCLSEMEGSQTSRLTRGFPQPSRTPRALSWGRENIRKAQVRGGAREAGSLPATAAAAANPCVAWKPRPLRDITTAARLMKPGALPSARDTAVGREERGQHSRAPSALAAPQTAETPAAR
ncbi:hypothetical protein COCON_G00075190 [Conger conger]|uniref:Uncharacterized protein n=1 Tax=Conger conger TaxID=82655 RepID=A0A9Q1I1Z5_CONCO|nr:hypothetical protein COCON_G00075190 [Conger conger]